MRQKLSLNRDWLFQLTEVQSELDTTHDIIYGQAKAGGVRGPGGLDWNDNGWDTVQLPHDWSYQLPFNEETGIPDFGYKDGGKGWYRKKFHLTEEDSYKQLRVYFDGIATHSTIFFNGSVVHRHFSGYTSFSFDIADRAYFGDRPNVLAVLVDANTREGWWYEGAGIYRNVWLVKTDPLHVADRGVWINPRKQEADHWTTDIETTIHNEHEHAARFTVTSAIVDSKNKIVASHTLDGELAAWGKTRLEQPIAVKNPLLWDIDHPHLYTLQTTVRVKNAVVDELTTRFGYRTIRFCPDTGFYLNERNIKLKGTCNHQDHAGTGVALPDEVHYYRIKLLKEMGSNAYRAAHHNPAPEILNACDELGMLVLDENRNFESSEEGLAQVRNMVTRDRNHPSVVMYGLFNEEPFQGTPIGARMFKRMKQAAAELDSTRPFLGSMNGGVMEDAGSALVMDVTGFNYMNGGYEAFHDKYPKQPIVATETVSHYATRNHYTYDIAAQMFDNFDEQHALWGNSVRESWKTIDSSPYMMGTFVWTGFDYRGEPTPYRWPSVSSHFGILDTCGFPKDTYYLYQAFWKSEPILHIVSHWNWNRLEGAPIKVMTYTNCDEIEFYVNDALFDKQAIPLYEQHSWSIPYTPGTLKMIGYRNGIPVATATKETAGAPVGLRIVPHKTFIKTDGRDSLIVNVHAVDAEGRDVITANDLIHFECKGAATIAGSGNGNPNSHESDIAPFRHLFNGSLQLILRSELGCEPVELTFSSAFLEAPVYLPVTTIVAEPAPYVESTRDMYINDWNVTQEPSKVKQDPVAEIDFTDMNTWEKIDVGFGSRDSLRKKNGFVIYRTQVSCASVHFDQLPQLIFQSVSGDIEVYINGKPQYEESIQWNKEISVPLAAFKDESMLHLAVIIRIHEDMHDPGINDSVKIRNEKL